LAQDNLSELSKQLAVPHSRSHSDDAEDCILLGCYTASTVKGLPRFRRNAVLSSSGSSSQFTLPELPYPDDEVTAVLEMRINFYQSTRRNSAH